MLLELITVGEFTKILLCGCTVCLMRLFRCFESAKIFMFPVYLNIRLESQDRAGIFLFVYAFKARRIGLMLSVILLVLPLCRQSEIFSSIIKPISIYMITTFIFFQRTAYFSRKHYSVHGLNRPFLFNRIPISSSRISSLGIMPIGVHQICINLIYDGRLAFCKWNNNRRFDRIRHISLPNRLIVPGASSALPGFLLALNGL